MEKQQVEEKETVNEDLLLLKKIEEANKKIKKIDIKGSQYAGVNQRIQAFRSVYVRGQIRTKLKSLENGICVFRAYIYDNDGELIATGTAYEKENSSFINKTSFIENCETSAIGRALGIAGFGIEESIASAEEITNAIENQKPKTKEEAGSIVLSFGKHKGKKLIEILEEDSEYLEWLVDNSKDENIKTAINILIPPYTEEEMAERLNLMAELNQQFIEAERLNLGLDRNEICKKYNANSTKDLTNEQIKDIIKIISKKIMENIIN
jgi:hypothetical protein